MATNAERLAREIADLRRRLEGLERSAATDLRSVDGGSFTAYDEEGDEIVVFGRQSDESFGVLQNTDPETKEITSYIGPKGDATFRDLNYTGTFSMSGASALVDGVPLDDVTAEKSGGALAWGRRYAVDVKDIRNSEYALMHVRVRITENRAAEVRMAGTVDAIDPNIQFKLRVRYNYSEFDWPVDPDANSTFLSDSAAFTSPGSSGFDSALDYSTFIPELPAGYYIFRVALRGNSGSDQGVNALGDWTFLLRDAGTPVGGVNGYYAPSNPGSLGPLGSDNETAGAGGGTPPSATYVDTFDATDTQWWEGDNTPRGSGDTQFVGESSGAPKEGNRKAAIWFYKNGITDALQGATVQKVELYLYCHNGGTDNSVAIGSHTDRVAGSSWSALGGKKTDRQRSPAFDKGSGGWVEVTFDKDSWADPDGIAGLILGDGPTTNEYAFGFRGATHSKRPRLRITYTK